MINSCGSRVVIVVITMIMTLFSFANDTPFEKLTLNTNEWFSITESASTGEGTWTLASQATTLDWVGETGSKMVEFDTDLTKVDALSFVATSKDNNIRSFRIETTCSPMLLADLPTVESWVRTSGALPKVFFTVVTSNDGNTLQYYTLSSVGWVALTGATPPVADDKFILEITFDNRSNQGKVQFAIISNAERRVLSYNGNNWLTCLHPAKPNSVNFCGNGMFKVLKGNTHDITEQKIEVGGKDITVKQEDMALIGNDSTEVATKLADTNAASGRTYAKDYTLGIWKRNDAGNAMEMVDTNGRLLLKGNATSSSETTVKLMLNAIPPSADKVTYQLKASDDKQNWINVGDPQTNASAILIPLIGTTYRYYKVKATIK